MLFWGFPVDAFFLRLPWIIVLNALKMLQIQIHVKIEQP